MAGPGLSALKHRLQKLEDAIASKAMPPYCLVRFVDSEKPQDPEPKTVTCQGRRFTRENSESLERFLSRIMADLPGGEGYLILEELDPPSHHAPGNDRLGPT